MLIPKKSLILSSTKKRVSNDKITSDQGSNVSNRDNVLSKREKNNILDFGSSFSNN